MKTIQRLREIKEPGKYKHVNGYPVPIITIDEEFTDGFKPSYAVCVGNKWLMKGYNLRLFKTIGGAVRHLQQLAVEGVDDLGYWIDTRGSGGKLSGSFYPKGRKR